MSRQRVPEDKLRVNNKLLQKALDHIGEKSLTNLAKAIGINVVTLYNIKYGVNGISPNVQEKFDKLFNTSSKPKRVFKKVKGEPNKIGGDVMDFFEKAPEVIRPRAINVFGEFDNLGINTRKIHFVPSGKSELSGRCYEIETVNHNGEQVLRIRKLRFGTEGDIQPLEVNFKHNVIYIK